MRAVFARIELPDKALIVIDYVAIAALISRLREFRSRHFPHIRKMNEDYDEDIMYASRMYNDFSRHFGSRHL